MATATDGFIETLSLGFDPATRAEFGQIERLLLAKSMDMCGMKTLPDPTGTDYHACGECVCDKCGNTYFAHPLDWRLIGYGNVPVFNILCSGERVKL